jgi:hypothetical protein
MAVSGLTGCALATLQLMRAAAPQTTVSRPRSMMVARQPSR